MSSKMRYDDFADFSGSGRSNPPPVPEVAPASDWDMEATHVVDARQFSDDDDTDVGAGEEESNVFAAIPESLTANVDAPPRKKAAGPARNIMVAVGVLVVGTGWTAVVFVAGVGVGFLLGGR